MTREEKLAGILLLVAFAIVMVMLWWF